MSSVLIMANQTRTETANRQNILLPIADTSIEITLYWKVMLLYLQSRIISQS